jgi:hypothetical protein
MRYYPAFGVKSGMDALFRRFLHAGNQVSDGFVKIQPHFSQKIN